MPRDPTTGVYTAPAGSTAIQGKPISSAAWNNLVADWGNEITNTLDPRGETPMASNLNMGNINASGILNGAAATEGGNCSQILPGFPAGAMLWWPQTVSGKYPSLPTNLPLCENQNLSQATYPDLWALLGTLYGSSAGQIVTPNVLVDRGNQSAHMLIKGSAAQTKSFVPPIAKAAGYNVNTFRSDTFSSANVDMAGTFARGFQWYQYNWFGITPTAAHISFPGDGSISLGEGGTSSWVPPSLASAASIGTSPFYVGTSFGGGAYIEAIVHWNAQNNSTGGWPSIYCAALEGNMGTSQWPGQSAGYAHYGEIDIFEYFEGRFGASLNSINVALHDWYNVNSNYAVSLDYTFPQASFTNWHKVAMLWVPAITGVQGYINFYWNDVLVNSWSYTKLTGSEVPPPSVSTPWAFAICDQDHMVIQAGSNNTYPLFVAGMNVWQKNAASNLVN